MPIRFRCTHCHQLIGIARRRAGATVRCPTCAAEVVVPAGQVEVGAQAPQPPAPHAFERSDFGDILRPPPTDAVSVPASPAEAVAEAAPTPPHGRLTISPTFAVAITMAVVVAVVLAFTLGYLFGFLLRPTPPTTRVGRDVDALSAVLRTLSAKQHAASSQPAPPIA